jgi:hypothetical protein
LGAADEGQGLIGEDRPLTVEALVIDTAVAVAEQNGLDGGFESGF